MRYKKWLGVVSAFLIAISMASPMESFAETENVSSRIYVSPDGDDSAQGTLGAPLKTLKKAQEAVRSANESMQGDIEVILRGGVYHLDETFMLDSQDSGTNGYHVAYKAYENEKPVISGGKPVTGWTEHDSTKDIYVADLSGFRADFDTRQLYVDGKRAIRARGSSSSADFTKGNGFYTINANGKYKNMSTWKNQEDIELQSTNSWKNARLAVKNIKDSRINIETECWKSAHTQTYAVPKAINMVENAYELLDEENEWYYDKAEKKLYYIPPKSTPISDLDIVVGNLEYIVKAEGTAAAPVNNIVFEGLQFSYNTWLFPNTVYGYPDYQAGAVYINPDGTQSNWDTTNYQTEAGVEFSYTKNSKVLNCTFTSMGNAAVSFLNGAEGNQIIGNQVYGVSGNGIVLGEVYVEAQQNNPPERLVRGNEISNNTIHDIGEEYLDNVGIFVGYARETNIHHNTLYDLPYTAISMGWGWGETDSLVGPSIAGDNMVSHNLIHDYMKVTNDGGAIYTLGEQYVSGVYNNYIYNNGNSNYILYRDNGSAGFLDRNNVIKNSPGVKAYYFSTNYAPRPYHIAHDNALIGNFYTAGMANRGLNENRNIEKDNTAVAGENWPEGASLVMENAGVGGGWVEIPDMAWPNSGLFDEDINNVAAHAVATASSDSSDAHQSYPAVNVNDNKKHTQWLAKKGANSGEWIKLELDQEYQLNKVRLVLPLKNNFQYKYTIEYSINGETWNLWYDQSAYTDSQDNTYEIQGDPVTARYLRVTFNDTKAKGCGLAEFMAYKTVEQKLPIAAVRASSEYEDGSTPAGKAMDGDWENSRWSAASGHAANEWLEVDLGSEQSVDRFRLKNYTWRPSNHQYVNAFQYKIQYSNNQEDWLDAVVQGTDTEVLEMSYDFEESIHARYFRVYFTETHGTGCSLYEVELTSLGNG